MREQTVTHPCARTHANHTGWSIVEESVRLVRFILQVSTRRGNARSAFAGKVAHPSNRAGYTGEQRISIVRGCLRQSQSLCARKHARERERRLHERTHVCVRVYVCARATCTRANVDLS